MVMGWWLDEGRIFFFDATGKKKECKRNVTKRENNHMTGDLTSVLPQRFRVIVDRYSDLLLVLLFLFVNDTATACTW